MLLHNPETSYLKGILIAKICIRSWRYNNYTHVHWNEFLPVSLDKWMWHHITESQYKASTAFAQVWTLLIINIVLHFSYFNELYVLGLKKSVTNTLSLSLSLSLSAKGLTITFYIASIIFKLRKIGSVWWALYPQPHNLPKIDCNTRFINCVCVCVCVICIILVQTFGYTLQTLF